MENIGMMRLAAQQVTETRFRNVPELVTWMGAMQAQDLNSVKWAIGVRVEGSTEELVDKAINDGDIIRTHLLRPTWHFVAAADYPAILELTSESVRATLKSRRKQLELDNEYFKKSNPALQRLLENNNHLTREELMTELSMTLPNLDSSRMNHVLLEAELDGLICSGVVKKKQHSFALRSERFRDSASAVFNREESLAMLTYKYFRSHGPATINNFNWWSGLSMTECRLGHELIKDKLISEKQANQVYWFSEDSMKVLTDESSSTKKVRNKVKYFHLLPAYDEFIISYRDRSAVLTYEDHNKTVSDNGIFRPVIVLDGQVIGLWNKTIKKNGLKIVPDWFITPTARIKDQLAIAGKEYAGFLGVLSSD